MPDGSSSAAPVMIPGPSDFSSDRIQRDGAEVGKTDGLAFPSDQTLTQFSLMRREQPRLGACILSHFGLLVGPTH